MGGTIIRCARVLTVFALSSTSPAAARSQITRGELVGRVTDSLGHPVSYANIQVNDAARVVAGEDGAFEIGVPSAGKFVVEVRRIGFSPVRMEFRTAPDSAIQIRMRPISRRLETVNVVAAPLGSLALHGFYERVQQRQRGTLNGYFITPEDIERRVPSRASQMLEEVPGIQVGLLPPRSGQPPQRVAMGAGHCLATVYVNGARLNTINQSFTEEMRSAVFDDVVDPASLAGIEVYTRGSRAPQQYQGLNGSCAVVLIWTK